MEEFKREPGSGNWLVTYSDLITLLLVFFVLLYTLTLGVDVSAFNDFISHFQSSSSVIDQKKEPTKEAEKYKLREEWNQMRQFIEEQKLSSEVRVEKIKNGVKVTLSDSLTFNSGSATLLPSAKMILNKIAGIINEEVREVKTQGHTDNVPIADRSNFRSNWHLGAARAVSVVLYLNAFSSLPPERFEASSFGEYKPVVLNNSEEARRKNRRVEIYIRYNEDV